jgi:hypothetical protein
MILRIVLPALLFILLAETTVAQIRQTNPSVNTKVVPVVRQPVKDTVPKRENRPVKIQDNNIGASKISGIKTPKTSSVISNNQFISSNLKRVVQYVGSDPDVKPSVWVTEYHADEMKYITGKSATPQWQSDFIWYHIPESAASARFEISSLPFPVEEDKNFNGIIETKAIAKTKADSIKFTISFKQNTNATKYISRDAKKPMYQETAILKLTNTAKLLDAFNAYGTYYVRLLALDGRGAVINKRGNNIKIVPEYINFPPPPIPTSEDSLQSDYEITAVNYTKMHYPEPAFVNCIVVTGYNEPEKKEEQQPIFGPFGNEWEKSQVNQFKNSFPIGTIICPSPPKADSKSWYETAFNSVADAAAWTVNGASKVYSETKDYLKSKFSEYMCNYDPVTSANKKLLEQTGLNKKQIDDGCNLATGVVFEMAMSYAGIPPSIPNFDEMCKLAEGQVVQMLIQKAAEQTGMPCDLTCAELIAEGYDKMVEESSKKNIQNGGFFNYKPDPRGQYRLPYVEIEVTRKRQTQKGNKIMTNLFFTPSVEKTFSTTDKNSTPYTKTVNSADLYESIQLPVPYLNNAGDKIKLIVVLTPKFAYFTTDCINGKITGVEPKQHICLGWNVIETPGEDPKNSSGYYMMLDKSTISIRPSVKIKTAWGVNTKFVHHQ